MDPRTEQVKYLSDQYRSSGDIHLFCQILQRIDPLVLRQLRKLRYLRPQLYSVRDEDLYQCAVLGIAQAIRESPESETPERLQLKILSCIGKQVHLYHKPKVEERLVQYVPREEYRESWEAQDLSMDLSSLVHQGLLNEQDMELFLLRVYQGYSWIKLRDHFKISCKKLTYRFYRILPVVRQYLEVYHSNGFK